MSMSSSNQVHSVVAKLAPEYIKAITPYQGGKPISELAREMGLQVEDIVKLASNENPLGIPTVTVLLYAMPSVKNLVLRQINWYLVMALTIF
jgi:histidinol-phosphate/aromatic aminotransferase/cobyric acid decarboxylase-like protein